MVDEPTSFVQTDNSLACATGDYLCNINILIEKTRSSVLNMYDGAVTFLYSGSASTSQDSSNPPFEESFNGNSEEVKVSSMRNQLMLMQ